MTEYGLRRTFSVNVFELSEYSDTTAVSKMIGTTAGYVGYDDNSNTLTEKVRPSSITCSNNVNICGLAFSISSNRMTEYGLRRTFSVYNCWLCRL
jgi:hypothetical protein